MKLLPGLILLALLFAAAIPAWRWYDARQFETTFARCQQATTTLAPADADKLLGRPARLEHAEATGLIGDVYHYVRNGKDHVLVFVGGHLFASEINPAPSS